MVLVSGHGGGAVFHEHQGHSVPIEQGIENSGQPRVKEGGVAHKSDYFAGIIEQGKTGRRVPVLDTHQIHQRTGFHGENQ